MTVDVVHQQPSSFPLLLTSASTALFLAFILHQFRSLLLYREKDIPAQSFIADEFSHGTDGGPEETWKVKSLWIFPLKSCRGVELSESRVVRTGLEYDRQYMLAEWKPNARTGEKELIFITQRQYPLMARITTAIRPSKSPSGGAILSIAFPVKRWWAQFVGWSQEAIESFEVPLDVNEKMLAEYPLVPVKIWKELVHAHDMTRLLPAGLAQFIEAKYEVVLLQLPPGDLREVYRNSPTKEELGYQPVVGFADAYPLHLINLASVRDLNSKITESIPQLSVLRFRSNIILTGPQPFAEDDWKKISIGGEVYHTVCRTLRCKLPNVDQDTGVKHPAEPDRAMRSYRKIDEGNKMYACMGMQAVPASESGIIRVGQPIVVLETGEHSYIDQ